MADAEDVLDQLEANISALGDKATRATSPGMAENYALAALHLAEARAWIMSPGQSHGSTTVSD